MCICVFVCVCDACHCVYTQRQKKTPHNFHKASIRHEDIKLSFKQIINIIIANTIIIINNN